MDGWPRIPNPGSGKAPPRTTATSLPAPGSTVVANVEDELGEGMYSLRWAGQKINVSSRSPLTKGQALLLKSETSPEGKPRLVVVGSAPEQAAIAGRILYSGKKHHPAPEQQSQTQTNNQSRIGGNIVDTGADAGARDARRAQTSDQPGGAMSAGVAKANAPRRPDPPAALIGLVLEPLPDLEDSSEELLESLKEEKEQRAEEEKAAEEADAGEDSPETAESEGTEETKKNRRELLRPAPPGNADAAANAPANARGNAPSPAAAKPPPADAPQFLPPSETPPPQAGKTGQSSPAASGRPARPLPAPLPPGMENATDLLPDVPDAPQEKPARPQQNQQQEQAQPQGKTPPERQPPPQMQTRPSGTPPAAPAASVPPAPRPDAAGTPPPAQPAQTPPPAPGAPAAVPAAPAPNFPPAAASPPPQSQPAAQAQTPPQTPPAAPSGRPVAPPSSSPPPVTPAPLPVPMPAANVPLMENAGPTVPDVPAVPVDGKTPPAQQPSQPQQAQQPQTRPAALPSVSAPPSPPPSGTPLPAADTAVPPSAPAPATPQQIPPQTPPPPSQSPQTPPPASGTYPRPAPPQSPAAGAAPAPAAPPPSMPPEAILKEALGQMVAAAEIPLGDPATDSGRLGTGNKMPEAVLDKAAAILLRGAGLSPDPETMEAAKALVTHNAPVDRENVQALLSAAAGIENPAEREATLRAAARLLSKDIPLSPPLVAGMTDVVSRGATAHQLLEAASAALAPETPPKQLQTPPQTLPPAHTPPEAAAAAEPLMAAAREVLDMLHVDLARGDAAAALERYMSTFGREALGRALALVETATQAALENNPRLQRIDQALTAILTQLQPEMEAAQPPTATAQPAQPSASPAAPATPATPAAPQTPQTLPAELLPAAPPASAPPPQQQQTPPQEPPAQPVPQQPVTPPPPANRPINAYLNAPKALPIAEMLKNLPPMPKVVSLGTPPPTIQPVIPQIAPQISPQITAQIAAQTAAAQTAPQILPGMLPGAIPQPPANIPALPNMPGTQESLQTPQTPEPPDPQEIFRSAEALRRQSGDGVLNKLGALFQIPGLNREELELLRPGGFLDRFLNSENGGAAARPASAHTKAEAESLLRELTSDNPRIADRARQELQQRDPAVLRETASRLTQAESETLRADPLVNKLADSAGSLRDLGRQLLAVKAENLAGQDRNPGVMLAEIPFKLNDDAGDGRMQMFYRRGKKKGDGWSSRVILDLNTTRMGPVLGDMRFFAQDMTLNMFVDKQDAADYLSASAEELAENLSAKGFRVKMKFMVLPPPPPPPSLSGERPPITLEDAAETAGQEETRVAAAQRPRGRLDIEM